MRGSLQHRFCPKAAAILLAFEALLFGTPIVGLAAGEEQLAPVWKAFDVHAAKVTQPDGDDTVDHSTAVLLMKGNGQLADIISHDEPGIQALARLKALAG